MRRAIKSHCVNGLIFVRHATVVVVCCRKKFEIIQLSQISPFPQCHFVARRMFLSYRVNVLLVPLSCYTDGELINIQNAIAKHSAIVCFLSASRVLSTSRLPF